MDRRDFLRRGALGAAALAIAGSPLLDAAGVAAGRDDLPWWLEGDFAPVRREITTDRLEVTGEIPRDLTGLYVRNGSNPHPGAADAHWFIGDGMLHGVRLGDGDARGYMRRWVQTERLRSSEGLTSGGPPSLADGYANVSVVWHADRLLASGEIGWPWELSPRDLSTVGPYDFGGRLTTSMTAHPKIDPDTGELHFFGYWFTPPYLTYHVADASGALVRSEIVEVAGPTMVHDFAITERDVVFWELPVVFDLSRLATGIPFSWDPSYGARLGVMPLGGPASAIRWVEIEPCYVFHGVNAYRDGDDVLVDVCRHSKMFDPDLTGGELSLRRWRIATGAASLAFSEEIVEDRERGELPTRDPRRVGRRHRYGYLLESHDEGDTPVFDGLVKQDFRTGRRERWTPGGGGEPNEFLFVPDGPAEDDGHLLSYVFDPGRRASDLVIVDARRVTDGPVATVHLPTRVPHGFHATFVPE